MPSPPVSLSLATAIQLSDLVWHNLVPGSLTAALDPTFTDPTQTDANGNPLTITPGDTWMMFQDVADNQIYACPFRSVVAVKLAAPA